MTVKRSPNTAPDLPSDGLRRFSINLPSIWERLLREYSEFTVGQNPQNTINNKMISLPPVSCPFFHPPSFSLSTPLSPFLPLWLSLIPPPLLYSIEPPLLYLPPSIFIHLPPTLPPSLTMHYPLSLSLTLPLTQSLFLVTAANKICKKVSFASNSQAEKDPWVWLATSMLKYEYIS